MKCALCDKEFDRGSDISRTYCSTRCSKIVHRTLTEKTMKGKLSGKRGIVRKIIEPLPNDPFTASMTDHSEEFFIGTEHHMSRMRKTGDVEL